MRILVTGAQGMLGRTLLRRLPEAGHTVVATARADLDLTRPAAVAERLLAVHPQVVIHAAGMTAVDRAESEPELAWAGNALASANVACAAQRVGARLIAISTDYVFAGDLDRAYHEWDAPEPRTVYGRSKLAAERAIAAHCPDHSIVRTAWLYGPGGPSFVHTMLRLAAQDGPPLHVVDDQIGNPTSTDALARLLIRLIAQPVPGIVHGTCGGETSWCGLAKAIVAQRALTRGLVPCTSAEYPRPALRPRNSRLDPLALRLAGLPTMPSWEDALADFLHGLPHG
jgi:dTDP-4-dehydrorhamnose reductase